MDHKTKEILQALVDGKTIRYKSLGGGVVEASPRQVFALLAMVDSNSVQNLKVVEPTTIRIGDMDVPEPLKEEPTYGQKYWTICFNTLDMVELYTWNDDYVDQRLLERGLIHLDKESAVLHANALIALSSM